MTASVYFTTEQADGAYPNGTRVRKIRRDGPEEPTREGVLGTVIGSFPAVINEKGLPEHGYFVRWDGEDDRPIFVRGSKLAKGGGIQ